MKKIMMLLSFIALFSVSAFATEPVVTPNQPENAMVNQPEIVMSGQTVSADTIYFEILEVNGRKMDILVKANNAVDNFCNAIQNSGWGNTVSLICAFVPGNPVCTVYNVLSIGDFYF